MEFLLEIRTEEMPSSHVKTALSQLESLFAQELIAHKIVNQKNNFGSIQTFGSCRRLAVWGEFVERQLDKEDEITGPPKSVAFSSDGAPTPAALGFAKSQGCSVQDLVVIPTDKGEYMGLKKVKKGKPAQDILAHIVPGIISSLSFPKMMRWGKNSFRFSRPIKNILCLCAGQHLSFSVGGIQSTNHTTGHKIHCPQEQRVHSFSEYKDFLKKNRVLIDQEQRRKKIVKHIERKLRRLEAEILPDDILLEKLTYDVEHPYVFLGKFPQTYLKLPLEVLSTAMREGQSLFSVIKGKKQLPYFVGVADAFKDARSLIKKGNERVLKARLEDARFFWEQDLGITLKDKARRLNQIIYQEQLGNYRDKAERLKKIVEYIARKLEADKEKKAVVEAAELCKADLVSEMVREFPSLQGKVGGLYAKAEGYPFLVWKGIYEHYQPLSLDDSSPSSLSGAMLSIADKLDAVVGAAAIGIEVSGSKDPFGLRRNAQGACKIILNHKLNFSFTRLVDKVIRTYGDRPKEERRRIKSYCESFFANRLQYMFESLGFRYDLVKASLSPGIENIYYTYLRLKALDHLKESPQFEPMILIAKRVNNILKNHPRYKINEDLLIEKEERELFTTFSIIKDNTLPLVSQGDFAKAQRMILRMRSPINHFFDRVLVMVNDRNLRKNRLGLLQEISKLFGQIADYSQVVVEG